MPPISLEDYWERLENHDWFYPWSPNYNALKAESKELQQLSRLSGKHLELYTTFSRVMIWNIILEGDDVMNASKPPSERPESV